MLTELKSQDNLMISKIRKIDMNPNHQIIENHVKIQIFGHMYERFLLFKPHTPELYDFS